MVLLTPRDLLKTGPLHLRVVPHHIWSQSKLTPPSYQLSVGPVLNCSTTAPRTKKVAVESAPSFGRRLKREGGRRDPVQAANGQTHS